MIDDVKPYPHAVGPEKAVLSILLQYPEMIHDAPSLTADHFHLPGHRIIFELVRDLSLAGKPIELVSFIQILIDQGKLDKVGGPSAVVDVNNYQPSVGSFQTHLGILNDKLARRMTIAAAHEMERVAYESEDKEDIIEVTSTPISEIHDVLTANRPARSSKSILVECINRFEQLCKGEVTPMGIETSLVEINSRFRGLHPKQTVVISAYPGGGKTTLAAQLAIDAATNGHNALICSLEMPAESMMNRLLAYVARLPGDAVTDPLGYSRNNDGEGGITNRLLHSIGKASQIIAQSPLQIEDLTGANVYQIAACIRRSHRKKPLEVVVVDFAQRIRPAPEMRRESREQQLAHASNYLADLCKELGFCLLFPSQLNKEGAAKHAEAINEDADLHLQIRQDADHRHIGIAVVKDRHAGNDGTLLPLVLDGPMLRFIPKMM